MKPTTQLKESNIVKHIIPVIFTALIFALLFTSIESESYVYAETGNESGTAVVITKDGTVKDYGTDIRGAWHYCDKHAKSTMKLTSDVYLNDHFSTGGKTYSTDIIFDLNGYKIDCQNKTNAFNLFKNGGLKIIDSSKKKTGKIINGNAAYGGAIRTMGSLELDGITIQNCKATDALCGGGAIYAWVIDVWIFAINEPHLYINDCTIDGCVGEIGGALEVHADNLIPSAAQSSLLEKSFSNSGIAALAAQQEQEDRSNWASGASIQIINSTISNCKSQTKAGAINVAGEATLDNTVIKNCSARFGAGAINVDEGSTLKMFNSTISGCTVEDGNGGGVYIQYGLGGESHMLPGNAEIWGGSITGNKAKNGSGIYYPKGDVPSTLKIGGELVVKNNLDKSGKPDNVETEGLMIHFYDEGLYGNADVGVGTSKKGDEVKLGSTVSAEVAEATAAHMTADHKRGTYNIEGEEEVIGIYSKDNDSDNAVYMGASRKIELVDFQLTGRTGVKADINRETRTITARFPFSEGSAGEGAYPEPVKVIWASGKGGTCYVGQGPGEPGETYSGLNKYTDSIITTFKSSSYAEENLVFECNGCMQVWTVKFINEGETRCRVRVTNGSITGHIPDETGSAKDYNIKIGEEVELVADNPPAGKCFDYWQYVCRGISPYYEFNDWYNPRAKIVAPASKSKMSGLVFTACYTDIADVKVINGTHTDGTTVKDFKPGEHVKVTANTSLKGFDHWEVVSGNLTLTKTQAKSRVLEFNMGYTDPDDPTSGKYGNITVKAVALEVEEPVAKPGSGKYTGNQQVKLSCATENSVIYYSLNNSEYTKYKSPISLSIADEELQKDYTLDCYSVLTDGEGQELVRSDEVTYKYTIMNPYPKTACVLKVVNAATADGKTEDILKPGDKATVVADAPTGKYFKTWKVTEGKLSLTDEQLASETMSFLMPNCDITIEAVYDGTQILPFKATVENGTVNGLTDTQFFEGSEVTAAASPAGGMTFDHWTATGIELTSEQAKSSVFTFDMPGNDVELKASFVSTPIGPYTLSVTNGYLEETETKTSGKYRLDENVAVTAKYSGAANTTTYEFDHWEVKTAPQGFELTEIQKKSESIIITMPDGDVELEAVFEEVHYSDNVYVLHGTIGNTSEWMKAYNKGDTVTVSADKGGSLTFDSWTVYGVDLSTQQKATADNMSFIMPDNPVILIAEYTSTPTTSNELITVNGCNYAKGESESTSQKGTYAAGQSVIAKAVNPGAASGKSDDYRFEKWVVVSGPDGFVLDETESLKETMEIEMPAGNLVLKAVYAKRYATKVVHGSIEDVAGGTDGTTGTSNATDGTDGTAYEGDTIKATADTAGGLVFDHWESYGLKLSETQRYSSSFNATMPSNDIILEAVYTSGKIEPHELSVDKGNIVTKVTEANLQTAKLQENSTSSYYAGSKVIVKPYFGANQVFDYWKADGIELTEEESHQAMLTITMPDNDVSLTAVYRKSGVVPYVLSIDGGRITSPESYTKLSDNSAVFYAGCVVEITADTKDGWTFDHWDADGVKLSLSERKLRTISITMPESDVKLVAVYSKDKVPGTDDDKDKDKDKDKGIGTGDSNGSLLRYFALFNLVMLVIDAMLYARVKRRKN